MVVTSARENAYQLLRKRILHLDLVPGTALNEKELADELGISRTPVREAIIMLSLANLVIVKPQSGTFVSRIDTEQVEMEQFLRFAWEKEILHNVSDILNETHRIRYDENLQLYRFYLKSQNPNSGDKLLELDNEFHKIPFDILGKQRYFDFIRSKLQHIERLRILSLKAFSDDSIPTDHENIVNALFDKKLDLMDKCLDEHMNRYRGHLKTVYEMFPDYFDEKYSL